MKKPNDQKTSTHRGQRKDPRGGPGRGQGRKKGVTFKEPTVIMRVPKSLVSKFKAEIEKHKSKAPKKGQ